MTDFDFHFLPNSTVNPGKVDTDRDMVVMKKILLNFFVLTVKEFE